jgi:hypothetical protein
MEVGGLGNRRLGSPTTGSRQWTARQLDTEPVAKLERTVRYRLGFNRKCQRRDPPMPEIALTT